VYFRIQDIDKNGGIAIFSKDKHSHIRWEEDADGVLNPQ